MDDEFLYEIEYDCQWGTRTLSADFARGVAITMALRLFEHPADYVEIVRSQG